MEERGTRNEEAQPPLLSRFPPSTTDEQPADEEEDGGANGGDGDRAQIQRPLVDAPPAEKGAEPAAEKGAANAEDDRDDAARGIAPGDEELRERSGDETEKNPVEPERHGAAGMKDVRKCEKRNAGDRAARRIPPLDVILALWRATHGDAIDPQQEHGTHDGEHDTPERKAFQTPAGDETSEESAEEGPHDADENGDDESTGIIARHQRFRDRAGNESKHDPG